MMHKDSSSLLQGLQLWKLPKIMMLEKMAGNLSLMLVLRKDDIWLIMLMLQSHGVVLGSMQWMMPLLMLLGKSMKVKIKGCVGNQK